MPAKNRVLIGGWLLPKEKEEVVALARQTHLTTSELIRRLVLGRNLPDVGRHKAVLDLVQMNADLARLGNLLRMALSDEDFKPPGNISLETLLDKIMDTQSVLKSKIREL